MQSNVQRFFSLYHVCNAAILACGLRWFNKFVSSRRTHFTLFWLLVIVG